MDTRETGFIETMTKTFPDWIKKKHNPEIADVQ